MLIYLSVSIKESELAGNFSLSLLFETKLDGICIRFGSLQSCGLALGKCRSDDPFIFLIILVWYDRHVAYLCGYFRLFIFFGYCDNISLRCEGIHFQYSTKDTVYRCHFLIQTWTAWKGSWYFPLDWSNFNISFDC